MESLQLLDDDALLLVDDLLDLSCSDLCEEGVDSGVDSGEPTTSRQENGIGSEVGFPANCSLQSAASQEEALYSPPDELTELDWLSSFVEESPDQSNVCTSLQKWFKNSSIYKEQEASWETNAWLHTSSLPQILDVGGGGSAVSIQEICSFRETWKAGRSRSKRSRSTVGRVWSLHTLTSAHQQQRVHKRSALHDDYEVSSLDYEPSAASTKPRKKPKKAASSSSSSSSSYSSSLTCGQQLQQRRCSHCQVTTTPQWRAGPMGPKSLCNACGVRYKSGRLVPEYRPAASPTFATHLHSNSHKKVMEMRLLKSRMAPRENSLHSQPPNLHCDQEELSVCSQGSCVHTV